MTIPTIFTPIRERTNATYSGFDIATGTGQQTFYGGLTNVASAAYVLRQEKFDSDNVMTISTHTDGQIGANSYAVVNKADFDIVFTRPQIIQGVALVNIPHGGLKGTSGKVFDSHARVTLRTVRKDVETDIAFASGSNFRINQANTDYRTSAIRLNVPRTKLKANDTLRVNVEQFAKNVNTSSQVEFFIAHDPNNKDASNDIVSTGGATDYKLSSGATIFKVDIPFVVDLG